MISLSMALNVREWRSRKIIGWREADAWSVMKRIILLKQKEPIFWVMPLLVQLWFFFEGVNEWQSFPLLTKSNQSFIKYLRCFNAWTWIKWANLQTNRKPNCLVQFIVQTTSLDQYCLTKIFKLNGVALIQLKHLLHLKIIFLLLRHMVSSETLFQCP